MFYKKFLLHLIVLHLDTFLVMWPDEVINTF